MNLPRILIISTEKGKANEIAMNIGGVKLSNQDHFEYHLWNIQNKYYKTQVLICSTENFSQDISVDGVEALIVHHDPQAANADQNLKEWSSLITSLAEAEVLLFSCHFITDTVIRNKVIKWCLQNRFELIELNRPDVDASEADSENNKYGIERIIEALHAHMWPNMILKGKSSDIEEGTDMNEVEEQFENIELSQDSTETLPMENMLDGIMGEENADFGELFSQLRAMKEHAALLPTNQRRIAAEQLVTAFWKAMGGDPSEMED
ncbi:PREDICTED: alpha- and gamma-adaptin-binding protein p34-like [Eufriesea mexicana]|uniref:alpha- and gamma-adaptin-binding protein p34-like n=1 Tax=Eufriesea mexicana TaxID=516756 RepID=UPI00083BD55F|nr:PREDICTED: alpha- and gamma-adaptin-binding protein p34-like [Eufriesea mexicana]